MDIDIAKYFWDLNAKALRETKKIFKNNHSHPKFTARLIALLSRCDRPKELFSLLEEKEFISIWPKIRSYWQKVQPESDFRDWWETVYEELLQKYKIRKKTASGRPSALLLKIGKMIARTRVDRGLSQKDLALRAGMKQPDISEIEEGRRNITLETLSSLCRALKIKSIKLEISD